MTKAQKFRDLVRSILIRHYDQDTYKNIVNQFYEEIYGKKK
jgi:hypothetical protein